MMKENTRIPTESECMELMKKHRMLPNIISHSIQVMKVSLALVDALREPDSIDRDLIIASSLLHDIAKTRTIETKEMRHDLIGGDMLRKMGYESIARIVESHVILEDFNEKGGLEEREIVYYADKRVMHDTIVSIETRVDDLARRYGFNETIIKLIKDNKEFVLKLERKIQNYLTRDIESIVADL